jgi:hypothetical protein
MELYDPIIIFLIMRTYKITDSVSLYFDQVKENFFPKLRLEDEVISIPLLVAYHEIDVVTNNLKLINFGNLPLHYIKMIIAGCISTVLKYHY